MTLFSEPIKTPSYPRYHGTTIVVVGLAKFFQFFILWARISKEKINVTSVVSWSWMSCENRFEKHRKKPSAYVVFQTKAKSSIKWFSLNLSLQQSITNFYKSLLVTKLFSPLSIYLFSMLRLL